MARNNKTVESTKPTHNLVIKVPTKSGKMITLGKIGLFEGNKAHEKLVEMSDDVLETLLHKAQATIIEYGQEEEFEGFDI